MTYTGVIHGNRIDLDAPPLLPPGTRVVVDVSPATAPRKGSPAGLLELAGTMTPEDADHMLAAAREVRRIDEAMWQ